MKKDKIEEVKESRLLTKEQMRKINDDMPSEAKYGDVFESIAKAQDAKTASIKDAEYNKLIKEVGQEVAKFDRQRMDSKNDECQDRVERIFKTCDPHLGVVPWYQALKKAESRGERWK